MAGESKHLEKHVQMEKCIKKACDEVLYLWGKASLPTRSRQCVLKEIRKLWKTREGFRKSGRNAGASVSDRFGLLFDISN